MAAPLDQLGITLIVTVGAFVLMALLYSYLKFERLMHHAGGAAGGNLEPRAVFLLHMARRLSIGSTYGGDFSLIVMEPRDAEGREEACVRLRTALRSCLRRSDDVLPLDGGRAGVIVDLEPVHLDRVLARVRAALDGGSVRPGEPPGPVAVRAGTSHFPGDGETTEELLAAAERALEESRADGSGPWIVRAASAEAAPVAEAPAPAPAAAETALLDPLTGILRSDKMGAAARKFIARGRRLGRAVSVVYLDVDRLADVNERFGRNVGDQVLQQVGRILQQFVRESDLIGRMEDDDFLALLECAPADAVRGAGRLLEQIRAAAIPTGVSHTHFTVSMGIAGYPDHGGAPQALLDAAETALGIARRRGQNLCVLYEPSMGVEHHDHGGQKDVL